VTLLAVVLSLSSITGSYFLGDGLGVNWTLHLDADQRFVFKWRGCLGVYATAVGTWALRDDHVALTVERAEGMAEKLPHEFTVVTWGDRTYLVSETKEFCKAVNEHREPLDKSWGEFFLRDGWRGAPSGQSSLSQQCASEAGR